MKRVLLLLLLLGLASPVLAQNVMRCSAQPNFACAVTGGAFTQVLTGTYELAGTNPLVFEGSGVDGNETTVAVSNPTADHILFIPDADSATGVSQSCGAGNHLVSFSSATGLFACSPDSGGSTHTILSATHTDTTPTGTLVSGDLLYADGTPKWFRLPRGNSAEVLQVSGTTLIWAPISGSNIGAGDLANVLVWRETAGGTWPSKTIAQQPRTADTVQVMNNGIILERVTSCAGTGLNEYTITGGTLQTLTMCESADPGAGFNTVRLTYER